MLTSLVGPSLCAVIPSYTMLWLSRCFNCRLKTVWSFKIVKHLALLGHSQEPDTLRPCRCETLSSVLEHLPFLKLFKITLFYSFCCIFIEGISWWRCPFPFCWRTVMYRWFSWFNVGGAQRFARVLWQTFIFAVFFAIQCLDAECFFLKCLIFYFHFVVCIFLWPSVICWESLFLTCSYWTNRFVNYCFFIFSFSFLTAWHFFFLRVFHFFFWTECDHHVPVSLISGLWKESSCITCVLHCSVEVLWRARRFLVCCRSSSSPFNVDHHHRGFMSH